jgi:hypothetical protein
MDFLATLPPGTNTSGSEWKPAFCELCQLLLPPFRFCAVCPVCGRPATPYGVQHTLQHELYLARAGKATACPRGQDPSADHHEPGDPASHQGQS